MPSFSHALRRALPFVVLALTFGPDGAIGQDETRRGPRNFDARLELNRGLRQRMSAGQTAALGRFRAAGRPEAVATVDPATGAVRSLSNPVGRLSATGSNAAPRERALDFVRDHLEIVGLAADDLDELEELPVVVNRTTGTRHVYFVQRAQGIPVYNAQIHVNLDRNGAILGLGNSFVPNLRRSINATRPAIGPERAWSAAAAHLGLDSSAAREASAPRLIFLPIRSGQARLVWNFQLGTPDGGHYFDFTVDAVTGEVWTRFDWVAASSYRVYPRPTESPSHASPAPPSDGRTLLVDPADTIASPFGWHDTNGVAGAEFTNMRGNNVHAYEDSDANNAPPASEPSCGASLACDFAIDLTQEPAAYSAAAVANLFYWNNVIHDVQYRYGFDEAAGNFQVNNYGNGGLGGDDVRAEAQDGGGTNNANFLTPPDGSRPRMQMYLWTTQTPRLDGDFDNGIIIHEYGHGISNRLVGGPTNVSCLNNAQQPGEGLSDWWALAYTAEPGDAGTDARGIGTYALGQPPDGDGIRGQPYSTDPSVNTWTYSSINGMSVPHGVGSVWAQAAWEVYWALVDQHGYDPDLYDATGTAGNQRAMLYVNEGLQNTVCSPAFTDVRDGIIQAAVANHGGEDVCLIWEAFAGVGLGVDAVSGGPDGLSPTDGFQVPASCLADFFMEVSPTTRAVCAPANGVFTIGLTENTAANPVDLSVSGTPAGTTASFGADPASTPSSTTLTIPNTGAASPGAYQLAVTGSNASGSVTHDVTLDIAASAPGTPGLISPADASVGVARPPSFAWTAVAGAIDYTIEIALDVGFSQIVHTATTTGTTHQSTDFLSPVVPYYWRVVANNGCGSGVPSDARSFTTSSGVAVDCLGSGANCDVSIPDGDTSGVTSTIEVPPGACLAVTDLDVALEATHTWVGDLVFRLTHEPSGTTVTVFDRPGVPSSTFGCSSDDLDIVLDDEGGGGPIENVCSASGAFPTSPPAYTPNESLQALDGFDPAGTWTLHVADHYPADPGDLVNWRLDLECPAPLTPGFYEETTPGISYSGSWATYSGPLSSGGSFAYTNVPGDTASFHITGANELTLFRSTLSNRGPMRVCIDATCQDVDNYSPTAQRTVPVSFDGFSTATHAVTITNLSSYLIDLDAVAVVYQETVPPTNPTGLSSTSHTVSVASSDNTIDMSWNGDASDADSGVAGFSVAFDQQASTVPDATVDLAAGAVSTTSPLLPDGTWYFHLRTCDSSGNCAGAVHAGPYVVDAAVPLPPGYHEQTDGRILYSGSWGTYSGPGPSGGSFTFTNTQGDLVSFEFTGTGMTLYRTVKANRGPMEVCVDAACSVVDNYSASQIDAHPVTVATGLPNTDHGVTIRNLSSSYIDLDAVEVLQPLQLGFYEEDSPGIAYSGSWATYSGPLSSGGSFAYTSVPGDSVSFQFAGANKLTLFRSTLANRGPMEVCIDASCQVVENYSPTEQRTVPVSFTGFSTGTHAATITNLSPYLIDLDAVAVVYEETVPPTNPTGLWSTSHTAGVASSDNTIDMSWNSDASDADSGVAGFSVAFDQQASTVPDATVDLAAGAVSTTSPLLPDGTWYFHLRTCDSSGNCAGAVHAGPYVVDALVPLPPGYHEQTDGRILYSGSWGTYSGPGPSGGSFNYTNTQDDLVSFEFAGTGVTLYRTVKPNRGPMEVCVDAACSVIDNYSATQIDAHPVTVATGLPNTDHGVTIRNLSSSYIDLDAVEVLQPLQLGFYEENAAGIAYSGGWATYSGPLSSGGSFAYTSVPGDSVSFQFAGANKLTLFRSTLANRGPMEVCIDASCQVVENYSPTEQRTVPVSFTGFSTGTHTATITNLSPFIIDLDAVAVVYE